MLIAARALQGVGGALLVPGSLSIIEASFAPGRPGRAIGTWTGLGGVATAIGPLVGGWLVTAVSWRLIFLLNLPLAVLVVAWPAAMCPTPGTPRPPAGIDWQRASLVVLGLPPPTYALIEGPSPGVIRRPSC